MFVSKKCTYALKAIFELALRSSSLPVKINVIARSQYIPPRFLEVILNQLKHLGYVRSIRGKEGGYMLAIKPEELTVGEIIRAVQGPIGETVRGSGAKKDYTLHGDYAFTQMWEKVRESIHEIYDKTSFSDLIELEKKAGKPYVTAYVI